MLASTFGVGQVLWSLFWFFLFVIWLLLLFRVFTDIFRSKDLGGVAKVLWSLLVIVTPYIGVFIYLIVRGGKMAENELAMARAQDEAMRSYIRDAAGGEGASPAAELERLVNLRDRGVISDEEFAALKAKILT